MAILQHTSTVLGAESGQWVVENGELILPSAELPEHVPRSGIDLHYRVHVKERHDVIAVQIEVQRVRVIEILIRNLPRGRVNTVIQREMVPRAPGELWLPGRRVAY